MEIAAGGQGIDGRDTDMRSRDEGRHQSNPPGRFNRHDVISFSIDYSGNKVEHTTSSFEHDVGPQIVHLALWARHLQ